MKKNKKITLLDVRTGSTHQVSERAYAELQSTADVVHYKNLDAVDNRKASFTRKSSAKTTPPELIAEKTVEIKTPISKSEESEESEDE